MDCLVNIGGAILGPVFNYMFAPVGHQLDYLFSYKDKIKNLKKRVGELDDKIKQIQSDTEQAKNEGNAIMGHVQDLQEVATTTSEEAKHFLEPDPDHTRARCSCRRPLPNLALRRRLSKEAKEMAEEIERLIRKVDDFGNNISFRPAVQHSFEQKDFAKFETGEETLREMMEALRNPEVRMIGLCGFGGMGKTMLVKEVARLAKEGNLFSKQILAVVSQNRDIKQIQQRIAEQLGLKFEEEDVTNRAELLGERLKKEQKILIVLDDVWTELDLSEVGIRFKDDNKESKIILTSRFQGVCRDMGADEKTTLEIKGLNNGEAMDLFNRIVGDVENAEFRSIATEVIGECGGLPLAIVTIASALKIHKSLSFWRDALQRLKQSSTESLIYGKMYNCFKTVYDELGNEAKSLLLICSVYKDDENVSLQELMGYVMVLDLFRNVRTLKQARDRVESLVYNLKAYCLLSDGDDPGTVKVHDVIRDVAISIASELEKNPMYCLRGNERFEDGLKEENSNKLYAISVPGGGGFNDDQLPERLECPRLKLLMLRTIGGLEITDRFFEDTEALKALRLDVKGGKKLASSFRSLQNLKALHLRIWKGEDVDIAIIGELTNLLILDLSDSKDLVALPKEIGNLSRLQVLNLSGCYGLRVIEPNVISRLVQLEELYMEGVGEINASLVSEIKDLRKLRVLHIKIPDVSFVPEDMFSHLNLERYHIQIGPKYGFPSKSRSTRVLQVNNLKDRSLFYDDGFQRLMKKSDELRLESIPGVSHIVNELDASSFQDLECLELIKLENLESFMPTSLERPTLFNDKVVFNKLHELTIQGCKSLMSVWALDTVESLQQLKKLSIGHCDLIEPNVISRLVQLEELYMEDVGEINASLVSEIKDLQKLRVLHIRIPAGSFVPDDMFNLRNLERYHIQIGQYFEFTSKARVLWVNNPKDRSLLYEDDFQRFMKKSNELRLKSIPGVSHIVNELDASSFQDLECLKLTELENLESFMPTSPPTRSIERPTLFNDKVVAGMSFRNLQELMISKCNNVQYMFSFAMVESLIQLKKLEVSECEAMEQIVTKAVGEYGRLKNIISFPKLKSLELCSLPKLERFCEGDCIEFPSLSRLIIWACYELRTFIPNSHESTVTLLPAIEERELEAQQTLFNEKVVATNLTDLVVWKCHGLISLFNSSTATSLAQLTRVFIGKCNQMTQVIHVNDQMEDESATECEIVFNQLKILALHCLPNLKCFLSGINKLQFPNFETIILSECPEMRSFSHGTINTPNLDRLIIAELDRRLRIYLLDWVFRTLEKAKPIEELWEGDLNRSIRKLWDDSYIALQWIFSETVDDQNFEEDTADHDQKIQNNEENTSSSSSE